MKIDFEELIMDAIEIEDEQDREAVFKFLKNFRKNRSAKYNPNDLLIRTAQNQNGSR